MHKSVTTITLLVVAASLTTFCEKANETIDSPIIIDVYSLSGGWGYDLIGSGKIMIHQPIIPAIHGIKAFASSRDAKAVACLMRAKLTRHIFPPSITPMELDSLGIIR